MDTNDNSTLKDQANRRFEMKKNEALTKSLIFQQKLIMGKTMKQTQLLPYWLYPRNCLETKFFWQQFYFSLLVASCSVVRAAHTGFLNLLWRDSLLIQT